ncbi:MAG: UDP-N-acetylmuramate dehydrogenase [Bacteroidetes bacterium]|nr:UDP-N-acetylmuramate dehydrogenase [Bacteroidota bacterium]
MHLEKNVSLKSFNTFGIDVTSDNYCEVRTREEFIELTHTPVFKAEKNLILGGGSNVLFTKNFDGLVIRNSNKGIEIISETDHDILLRVNSGEVWHNTVLFCVKNNWGGIENLSLIPGTIGAAPIQNIGAYGVEVREVIEKVEVIEFESGEIRTFTNKECEFGYRESIFKRKLKEKIFISSVTLRLSKKNHKLNTSYGAIAETLLKMNIVSPTIQSVSDAVIKIRSEKLPDFTQLGNAGSFFKNPEIGQEQFEKIKKEFPSIPHYPAANQQVKVPAGWLIEQCGWKGKRINNAGVHAQQALVLVNFGNASGEEIFQLAQNILSSVKEKFSIALTPEVNIF